MRMLYVGSTAAKQWIPEWREPRDVDAFSDTEVPGVETFWHPALEDLVPEGVWTADPINLYTIKMSHAAWDLGFGSWEKHMDDAMRLKAWLGPVGLAAFDEDAYALLYSLWEEKHGKKRVDLNQDKSMFFDDAVPRRYDHDSVHYSCALSDRPQYEKYLDGEVRMDMGKVWAAPLHDQLDLFGEEIAATALERWVIPSDYKVSPQLAWSRAVKKFITSLSKGKSSRFVAERYDFYRKPTYDYVGVHKAKSHLLEPL